MITDSNTRKEFIHFDEDEIALHPFFTTLDLRFTDSNLKLLGTFSYDPLVVQVKGNTYRDLVSWFSCPFILDTEMHQFIWHGYCKDEDENSTIHTLRSEKIHDLSRVVDQYLVTTDLDDRELKKGILRRGWA